MVKIPNRGFTFFIGIFRLGDIVASSRILTVGEYFSIKPKKEELKQIFISYDKKKSTESGNFVLSCENNDLEMCKEDARLYVRSLGKESADQNNILGYDGLKLVGKLEDRGVYEKEEDNQGIVEYLINSIFCDLESIIDEKYGEGEELDRFYKVTTNLIKAIKNSDSNKILVCLGELEIIDLNLYYDNTVGEEENMEDSYERKFYRSVSFYAVLATMKISTSKAHIKEVKVVEYKGEQEKYIQIFLAAILLLK